MNEDTRRAVGSAPTPDIAAKRIRRLVMQAQANGMDAAPQVQDAATRRQWLEVLDRLRAAQQAAQEL
jgi:hypothetical protein